MHQYGDTQARADFTVIYDGYYYHHIQIQPNKEVHFQRQKNSNASDPFGDVVFHTDTRSNAGVGIGTSDPGTYDLAVEGDLGARKIVVTDATFADYVFEEGHDLPAIPEVEAFINRHGRLPGMPSGDSVEKEGQNLGMIQVALTEKVEELVLYTIEQHRDITALQKEIEEEQDRRAGLEKQLRNLDERLRELEDAKRENPSGTVH